MIVMKHTRTVKCINLTVFKKLYQQSKIQISLINKHLKLESIHVTFEDIFICYMYVTLFIICVSNCKI